MSVKVTIYVKTEFLPATRRETTIERVEFSGIKLTGVNFGRWWFDVKVNGKRYNKVYIDGEGKVILGRSGELSQWETICEIDDFRIQQL